MQLNIDLRLHIKIWPQDCIRAYKGFYLFDMFWSEFVLQKLEGKVDATLKYNMK